MIKIDKELIDEVLEDEEGECDRCGEMVSIPCECADFEDLCDDCYEFHCKCDGVMGKE